MGIDVVPTLRLLSVFVKLGATSPSAMPTAIAPKIQIVRNLSKNESRESVPVAM